MLLTGAFKGFGDLVLDGMDDGDTAESCTSLFFEKKNIYKNKARRFTNSGRAPKMVPYYARLYLLRVCLQTQRADDVTRHLTSAVEVFINQL